MLLSSSFENFRSFRKKTTLSMRASAQRSLDDVLIRSGKRRILPYAVLYGENASGKSNVILAMHTLCTIVKNGSIAQLKSPIMMNLELFPFLHDGNTEPITFEMEFLAGKDRYIYLLSLCVEPLVPNGERFIKEEKLEQTVSNNKVMLFHRTKDKIEVGHDNSALRILGHKDSQALHRLVESVVQNMDEKILFLSGGFKSTISKTIADKIIGYFTHNVKALVSFADMQESIGLIIHNSPSLTNDLIVRDSIANMIAKVADYGPQEMCWIQNNNKDGSQNTNFLEMVSMYKGILIPSNLMESAGTIRLLNLSFLLRDVLKRGVILMIDEIDNAMHPEIMKGLIALFGNQEVNSNGAQLVFVSHNPIFMDNDLMRRDQILFVEKDPDSFESTLHSLDDVEETSAKHNYSIIQNYFKGRYSRLPFVDFESILAQAMED